MQRSGKTFADRSAASRGCRAVFAVVLVAALIGAMALGPTGARGQDATGSVELTLPDPHEMRRVEASVDAALRYLAQHQRDNGSFPSRYGDNHGINAFCLLAFLGRGHVPGRGPYRAVVDRAAAHILSTQNDQGLYKSPNTSHGPMYEHGLATLAMVQAYGFLPSPQMRTSVQQAIDLIVKSQAANGGWRYQPVPRDHDLSVTVMQIVALRAAQNARLDVPQQTLDKALQYVRACAAKGGGFCYQPGRNRTYAQSAAGALSMQLLGAFDDEKVDASIEWLDKQKYQPKIGHFWYFSYYAMQAHFQAGGEAWATWHPKVRQFLFDHQNADGSWDGYTGDNQNAGDSRCYSTAVGAMCLEVYMHYLPAYQR